MGRHAFQQRSLNAIAPFAAGDKHQNLAQLFCGKPVGNLPGLVLCRETELVESVSRLGIRRQVIQPESGYGQCIH